MQSPALANRRAGLGQIKRASILTLIGLPELIGLVCGTLLALITLFAYLYFYLPAQSRLSTAQAERDRLQAVLRSSETNLKVPPNGSGDVNKINASMSDFGKNWLPVAPSRRMSLYARGNRPIKTNP